MLLVACRSSGGGSSRRRRRHSTGSSAFQLENITHLVDILVRVGDAALATLPDANEGKVAELTTEGCEGGVIEISGEHFGLDAVSVVDDDFSRDGLIGSLAFH